MGTPPTLDYAIPARRTMSPATHAVLASLMALAGMGFNSWIIHESLWDFYEAWEAHFLLSRNPKAFGRLIAPAQIQSLEHPVTLWLATTGVILACSLGLWLALHLLIVSIRWHRDPAAAELMLNLYVRIKKFGAWFTAIAFLVASTVVWDFRVRASNHTPIGSGPPLFTSAAFLLASLIPVWLVRRWLTKAVPGLPADGPAGQ
jgi:hypothetical protein